MIALAASGAPDVGRLASTWQVAPGLTAALALAAVLYLLGVRRAAARPGGGWPWRRTAAFLSGLAVIAVALESGVDTYADELLSIHMVQHLALTIVAPPLLVIGAPVMLALRTLRGDARGAAIAIVRSRVARALGHPLVAWSLFVGVMVAWHLTPLYGLAVEHEWLHELEHALYLATGVLFWMPVLGADPAPHAPGWTGRFVYMLLAMPPMGLIGALLAGSDSVRYPVYLAPARALGVSALGDQHSAGGIMWVGGTFLMALLILGIACGGLVAEDRRTRAAEAYADRRLAEASAAVGGAAWPEPGPERALR